MTQPAPEPTAKVRASKKYYAANKIKMVERNRALRAERKAKPVDLDEIVFAPKMQEEQFWDATTAMLLDLMKDGPMSWKDIEVAVELVDMNPRFMHHAIAYLEIKGRIHHVGMVEVTWHHGPKPEEERPCPAG